jgi:hypothetical protein
MTVTKAGTLAVALAVAGLAAPALRAQSALGEPMKSAALSSPVTVAGPAAAPANSGDETRPIPSPSDILQKYEAAVGGREAWSHFTSRYMKGIYQTEDESGFAAIEIFAEAPNLRFTKITFPNGIALRETCNGKTAWIEGPRGGILEFTGAARVAWMHDSEFNRSVNILLQLPAGKTVATAQVGKYSTYVLDFQPQKEISSKVYFDSASGFPVRIDDTVHLPSGDYPVQTYLDDYRAVDGVFFPFKLRHVEKGDVYTVRVTKIENNAPVDSSLFTKPDAVINTR